MLVCRSRVPLVNVVRMARIATDQTQCKRMDRRVRNLDMDDTPNETVLARILLSATERRATRKRESEREKTNIEDGDGASSSPPPARPHGAQHPPLPPRPRRETRQQRRPRWRSRRPWGELRQPNPSGRTPKLEDWSFPQPRVFPSARRSRNPTRGCLPHHPARRSQHATSWAPTKLIAPSRRLTQHCAVKSCSALSAPPHP